jgi:hypothetical protein
MRGELNGLKTLILNENSSNYYVYCFAHQLQLTLVVVAKNHIQIATFFSLFNSVLMLLEHYANIVTYFVKNGLLKLWKYYKIMKFLLVTA